MKRKIEMIFYFFNRSLVVVVAAAAAAAAAVVKFNETFRPNKNGSCFEMDAVTIVDSGIAVVDIVIAAGDGVAVAVVDAVRFILNSVDKKLTSYVEDVSIDLTVFMTGTGTSILPTTFN